MAQKKHEPLRRSAPGVKLEAHGHSVEMPEYIAGLGRREAIEVAQALLRLVYSTEGATQATFRVEDDLGLHIVQVSFYEHGEEGCDLIGPTEGEC